MAIDGIYDIEIFTPMGRVTGILRIKENAQTLNGSYEAHGNAQPLKGTITGNRVTFSTAVGESPKQIKLEFNGLLSSTGIKGQASADGSQPSEFNGRKRT